MNSTATQRNSILIWLTLVVLVLVGNWYVLQYRAPTAVSYHAIDQRMFRILPFSGVIEYENDDPTGRAFRWLLNSGDIRIVGGALAPVIVELTAHTGRPANIPTQLRISQGTRELLNASLTPGWRTIHLLVPYTAWHKDYVSAHYEITGAMPTDKRMLGLAVDTVRIVPTNSAPDVRIAWLYLTALMASIVVLGARYPRHWWVVALVVITLWLVQLMLPLEWSLYVPQYWPLVGWLGFASLVWVIAPLRTSKLTHLPALVLVICAVWLLRSGMSWIGACLLLGVWYGYVPHNTIETRDWSTRSQWLLMSGALVVAVLLRVPLLDELPVGMFRDEARHGGLAQLIIDRQYMVYSPFANLPAGYFYLSAVPIWMYGPSAFSIRIMAALLGCVTIPVAYWALYRWCGQTVALLIAVVLSTLLWHISMSRIGFPASAGPLLTLVAVGALWRALQAPEKWQAWLLAMGAGVATGAMTLGYHATRLMPLVVVGMIVVLWYQMRWRWVTRIRILMTWLVASVVVAMPILWYAVTESYNYMKRIDSTSLSSFAVNQGIPLAVALMHNAIAYLGAFFIRGDENARHFYMGMPQLSIVEATAFIVALVHVWRQRPLWMVWVGWYLVVATAPGVLSVDAPHALRTVESIVPVAIMVAYGLLMIVVQIPAQWQVRMLLVMLICTGVWSGYTYTQWQRDERAYAEFDGQITQVVRVVQQQYVQAQVHGATWGLPTEWRDGDVGVYLLRGMDVYRYDVAQPHTSHPSTLLLLLPNEIAPPSDALALPLPNALAGHDDVQLWCTGQCGDLTWLR